MKINTLLSLLLFSTTPAFAITLADKGKTDYVITGEIEKDAALELKANLERMTGASFELVTEDKLPEGKKVIYVGDTDFAKKQGLDFDSFKTEEWIWKTYGDALVLGGHGHYGEIHAVSSLLENEFGCHWFCYDSEEIPNKPTLVLEKTEDRGVPDFGSRQIADGTVMGGQRHSKATIRAHKRVMVLNQGNLDNTVHVARFPYYLNCHNVYDLIPPSKYFESHPEYFSMDAEGKRVHGNEKTRCGGGLCFSNQEMQVVAAENMKAVIARNRKELPKCDWPLIYVIGGLDATNYLCKCPECIKIIDQEGGDTGLLLTFANHIAREVGKIYPEVMFNLIASSDNKHGSGIPRVIRPEKNIMFHWAPSFTQNDTYRPITHPINKSTLDSFLPWADYCSQLGIWDYWNMAMSTFFAIPRIDTTVDAIAANLNFYYDHGTRWLFIENEHMLPFNNPNFHDLEVWLGWQLMKDRKQAPEKLIKVFMKGHFGPAEKEMTEFLNLVRENVSKEPAKMTALNNVSRSYQTVPFLEKCYDLCQKALLKTKGDSSYEMHVRREMTTVLATMLYNSKLKTKVPTAKLVNEFRLCCSKTTLKYCSAEVMAEVLQLVENEIRKYTEKMEIPTPAQFSNVPEDKLIKIGWDKMTTHDSKDFVKPDSDSVLGKSLCSPPETDVLKHGWVASYAKMWPLTFMVANWSTRRSQAKTIFNKELPTDEKFHWYQIAKQYEFQPGRVDCLGWWWNMQVSLSDIFIAPDKTNDINIYDIWISIKITGPAYIEGSKKPNGIFIDQVILIRK